jgi:hypothetical protein
MEQNEMANLKKRTEVRESTPPTERSELNEKRDVRELDEEWR